MRRILVPMLLVTALVAGCAPQQETPSFTDADVEAIRVTAADYLAAVRDTAWTTWVGFYTPDALMMSPNEPVVRGHDALLAWARMFPPVTEFTLTPVEVDGDGDLAYVYGTYTWTIPGHDAPDSGKYIELWRRQADGTWKISHDIFNSDLPAAPMP